jgi:hypothetical protein
MVTISCILLPDLYTYLSLSCNYRHCIHSLAYSRPHYTKLYQCQRVRAPSYSNPHSNTHTHTRTHTHIYNQVR